LASSFVFPVGKDEVVGIRKVVFVGVETSDGDVDEGGEEGDVLGLFKRNDGTGGVRIDAKLQQQARVVAELFSSPPSSLSSRSAQLSLSIIRVRSRQKQIIPPSPKSINRSQAIERKEREERNAS